MKQIDNINKNYLTEEERGWALAIKEALTKENEELAKTITDFEYAHHCLISKHKVSKAIKRIHRLDKFRKENGIPSALEHDPKVGFQTIQEFETISGGLFLSFGREDGGGRNISTWNYSSFSPANFNTKEDWQTCSSAFYYLFDAMHPDIASCRAGIVALFECEHAGYKNFSYHMEKHAAHLCQNAYPIRMTQLVVMDAPTIFSLFYALVKPLLSPKVRNAVQMTGSKEKIQHEFPKELISTTMGGTHTNKDMENNMLEGLKRRYANMASFTL